MHGHLDTTKAYTGHFIGNQDEVRLSTFITDAWKILEPKTQFVPGWHLDAIADHLTAVTNGHIHNLLINVPPRHCKSLSVSVFWPVWEWINFPERRWLFAAYASSLSIRDSLKCRRLIQSPWFQENWSSKFQLGPDQNEKMRFDNDKGGYRIATGVGGAATGEGGDRVVVDDPHAAGERQSDALREAVLIWWDETMSTRLNDPKNGARVIVMQRLHEKDLSGHVLQQGGYEHLCLPAEFDPARRSTTTLDGFSWYDPRTLDGELLWPQRLGKTEIADAKLRLGPTGYAGQFQQLPVAAGGARFQSAWFRHYTLSGNHYRLVASDGLEKLVPRSTCRRFAVMDPAGTEKSQNDRACYTVIQVWDKTEDHDMILVHQYREQVQTPDAMAAAIRIVHEFRAEYIAVEKDGLGLGMVQTIRRTGINVKPIKARGSKEARSEIAEIRMAAGMVYFPREAPYLWDLEQELLHFPNGEFADQVDALSHAAMQVQRLSGPPTLAEIASDELSQERVTSASLAETIEPNEDKESWENIE